MTCADAEVLAASLTPLNADKSIDNSRFVTHVQWLLDNGCDGVVVFGTTGEGNSFTVAERQSALAALLDSGIAPEKLMVATGCCAQPDTLALTRHALEHGVQRVLLLPPYYYKTVSDDDIYETFVDLIVQVDDESLRVYLYHFPKMAVVAFSPEIIERLLLRFPAQIAGVKDSTGDREHTEMLNTRFPSLRIYAGSEKFLLDYYRSGGIGCISATTNVTAILAAKVRDGRETPEADEHQQQLSAVRSTLEGYPMTGGLKGLLALHTGESAWKNVRLPLSCLVEDRVVELREALSKLNYPVRYG